MDERTNEWMINLRKVGVEVRKFDYMKLADRLWDGEVVSYIAKIHECKGRQELFTRQKPVELERLIEIARVQSTEASNKIEGIVTTSTRIKQLMNEKTTPKSRDESEIVGYRDVLNTIHESHDFIPIRTAYILQLHRDLLKHAGLSYGGQFKNTQNYINETKADGTVVTRFIPLSPYETEQAIEAICESYRRTLAMETVDPLILIPTFISDFLCIHPFNDGNGRMSRLLTLLLLYQNGYEVGKYISIEQLIENTKAEYYKSLQQSSENWNGNKNDYEPFVRYMLGIIIAAYKDFSSKVSLLTTAGMSKPDQVKEIIRTTSGPITKSEILEKCPNISQITVQRTLVDLTKSGVIKKIGGGRYTKYIWNEGLEKVK